MLFKKKPKIGVALFIALSMLLQLSGPLFQTANAESQLPNEAFIVEGVSVEGENATVDWNLVIDTNGEIRNFTHQFDFELENDIEASDLKTNQDVVIGTYAVTKNGKMSVVLHKDLLDSNPDLENLETNSEESVDEATSALLEVNDNTEPVLYNVKGKINISGVLQEEAKEEENKDEENKDEETILIETTQSKEPKDLGNIFTDAVITFGQGDGAKEIDQNTPIEIVDNMELNIKYDWKLDDSVNLVEGDYSIIKLPSVISLEHDETGKLLDKDDVTVGTFVLSKKDGTLKVIFNEKLVGKEKRYGMVWVAFQFDLSKFEENTTQTIKFDTKEEKKFTVRLKPKNGSDITKVGLADKPLSPNKITWTIDVNTNLKTIKNAEINDDVPDGLEVESIKLYHLNVGYDGKLTTGSLVADKTEFPINLGDINSAYRIEYVTTIKDPAKGPFKNVAVLTGDGVNESAESTVVIKSGSSIVKFNGVPDNASNSKNISWKIHVNLSQLSINNAVVKDDLVPGLSLKENSLEVYNLIVKEDGTTQRGGGNSFT